MVRARPLPQLPNPRGEGEEEEGLAQPLPVPGLLHTPARPAQSLEPILFPKLRI